VSSVSPTCSTPVEDSPGCVGVWLVRGPSYDGYCATSCGRVTPRKTPGRDSDVSRDVRSSRLAIAALEVGTFAIGTTEFVIAGVLPQVADSFDVSIPHAGLLVSGYALGVVVGAPSVTAAVASLPRKPVLVALLGLFVIGNLISALADSFALMMIGRIIAALCHGAFIGVASIVVARLVDPGRQARAIAALLTGLTVANVAGVPLGTLLGQRFGWRWTFWAITALGALAIAATAVFLPGARAGSGAGVRSELGAFRRPQVWLGLVMTALGFGAVYAPFTYVAPLMTDVAGFAASALTWLLVLFGGGLVVGNFIGARAADRSIRLTIATLLVLLTGILVLFHWTSHRPVTATLTLVLLGIVGYATVPAFTSRVISSAGETSNNAMASSATVAAFNLGNATGAYLGGRVVVEGFGYAATPLVGAGMAACAVAVAVAAFTMRQPSPAPQVMP